ncbi:hypothetical protein ACTA71_001793 [Dictyostelium dimigraforme]
MIEANFEQKLDKQVAIIGLGLRLPGDSGTPLKFWNNLLDGFDGIVDSNERWSDTFHSMGEISNKNAGLIDFEENWHSFEPLFFGINPTDAKQIDPQIKLMLKLTWEAFEDASIDPLKMRGTNTSVFVGAASTDYSFINFEQNEVPINVFNGTLSAFANRISYCFDLRGTSLTIDTACSSSLNAVHLGYESIVNGKSDCSVVAGCNLLLNPYIARSFTSINITGKSGRCNSFDESADGFVRSEGVVVLILKKLSLAIEDGDQIYCVMKGSSSNVDGTLKKTNFFAPSKHAQTSNIKNAFESSNGAMKYQDIDFFELHSTGTQVGDPIEVEAVADIFKNVKKSEEPLLIGSVKSNIGHLEPASGVASLAKVCLMFKHRQFVKNIHFNKPNPNIKFKEWNVKVCTETTPFPNKQVSMAINSFGITGSNACVLLSEYIKPLEYTNGITRKSNEKSKLLIPISTNSKKSLDQFKSKLLEEIDTYSENLTFNEFAMYQIHSKTTKLSQRSVLIGNDWSDLKANINEIISTKNNKSGNIIKSTDINPPIVFTFCGQGPQYSKMGLNLYENEPVFKESMDRLDSILFKYFGYSIIEKLRSIDDDDDDDSILINEPILAQPSIFMIQISLYNLFRHWGITPSILVGHSFGEVSCAYCSGMIDLETACFILYKRATIQNKTNGSGRLLAIGLNLEEFNNQFSKQYPEIEVSCFNSPSSIVICGNEAEILKIAESLKEKQIFNALLGTPSAFHSSKQDIIKDEILESTSHIKSKPPSITMFSTVTSNRFDENTPYDSKYIFDNLRKPVLFQQTIENIFKYIESNDLGNSVLFIELSPHPTLNHYVKEMVPKNSNYFLNEDSITVLSSLNRKKEDINEIQLAISQLYCFGYNVDFSCQFKEITSNSFKKCSDFIPHYQWDESLFWKEGILSSNNRKNGPPINQLGYKNESSSNLSYTSYIDIKEEPFRFLKDHQFRGKSLFPGIGYLDILLKIFPNQDVTVPLLEFKSQFPLTEGVKKILSTNLYKSAKNEYRATFSFKDQASGKWVQSSNGRILLKSLEETVKKVDVQSLRDQCNWTTLKRDELYDAIKYYANFSLLKSFQRIEEASYGDNKCFCKISLDPTSSYDTESFLNICIIDACIHPCIFFENQTSSVFERIENLKIYSSSVPLTADDRKEHQYVYSYIELIKQLGDYIYFNTTCFLKDGTVLFHSPLVTVASTIPTKSENVIECPNDQLFSQCLQSKDSILQSPLILKDHFNQQYQIQNSNLISISSLSSYLFSTLKKKIIDLTPEEFQTNSFEQLFDKYSYILKEDEVVGSIRTNLILLTINFLLSHSKHINQIEVSNFLANQIPKELLDVDNIVSNKGISYVDIYQHQLILDIISKSITPIVNEKIVFRILEIGCGVGELTKLINDKLESILNDNPSNNIDIEFVYSDHTDSKVFLIKERLFSSKKSCFFKIIDLNKQLKDQSFNPSYYDLIILSNTTNQIKDIKTSISFINEILSPNGHLLILDASFIQTSIDEDYHLENYKQWLSFNYLNSSLMKLNQWNQLLINDLKFNNFISATGEIEPYLIQVQKSNLSNSIISIDNETTEYDQIIIFGTSSNQINISNSLGSGNVPITIDSIEKFNEHAQLQPLTDKSLILFIEPINLLTEDNFNQVSMNYIEINQHLLRNEITGCKHVLISRNVNFETSNLFGSSIIGSFRYFCEFNQLNIYSLEFEGNIFFNDDDDNGGTDDRLFNIIQELTNSNKHSQKEFSIRNDGKIYYERIKLESNLKLKYKSKSYVEDKNELVARLKPDLTFGLEPVLPLDPNYVEVKVMASGVNFKDFLVYRQLIHMANSNQNGDSTKPQFGYELSGIVTKVGKNVKKFKVGDHVMGGAFHTFSSSVHVDQERIELKPSNISWVEASHSLVYLTSYCSLFELGRLDVNGSTETVLIHSATGGIGLTCIDLLKAHQFKGFLFVTVGTEEKKQFLKDRYGDFITEIYSTKNTDYEHLIKEKLIKLKAPTQFYGTFSMISVDLIVNTLPGDFMDANFNCLSQGGRIIDLSITHMTTTDTTDFYKFRNHIGYMTYESMIAGFRKNKHVLKIVVDLLASGKLKPIPFKVYPVTQIKDAIESLGDRKHIGKNIIDFNDPEGIDLVDYAEKPNNQNNNNNNNNINNNNNNKNDFIHRSPNYKIHEDTLGKTILLTGQTGLSSTIIKWIREKRSDKIESIIVLSKSPIKYELERTIGRLKSSNLNVYFKQVDISDEKLLSQSIDQLFEEHKDIKPIESIFHNAFSPAECEPLEINMDHLITSHSAKSMGAYNLHKLSLNWPIKQFVLSSSVTSILGSQRQCGYVAANCFIDALSRYRKSLNLPCISINWGLLEGGGFATRNDAVFKLFELQGSNGISKDLVWGSLDLLLQNQDECTNKMVASFEFFNTCRTYRNHKLSYKLDYFLNPIISKESVTYEKEVSIRQDIIDKFATLLSTDQSKLNLDIKVIDYGADSLLVVEVKNWSDNKFARNILSMPEIQNSTINQIINIVTTKVSNLPSKKK